MPGPCHLPLVGPHFYIEKMFLTISLPFMCAISIQSKYEIRFFWVPCSMYLGVDMHLTASSGSQFVAAIFFGQRAKISHLDGNLH